MTERMVTSGVRRATVRRYLWLAAGWMLVGLGALLVVIPLVSFRGFGLGFVGLAGPLLLAGFLVLVGVSWARWLGIVVIAAYTAVVWFVITTPLPGGEKHSGRARESVPGRRQVHPVTSR
jgi:hypothetical protein